MSKIVDLTGRKIPYRKTRTGTSGGFTVVEKASEKLNDRFAWNCQCTTCGKIRTYRTQHIQKGSIQCRCHNLYAEIQRGATRRNIPFLLKEKEMWDLLSSQDYRCALSGQSIYYNSYRDRTASLDRINSAKGYEITNIQWLHTDLNYMKASYPQEYFIKICELVYNYTKDNQ